jgi:hypothetical protein
MQPLLSGPLAYLSAIGSFLFLFWLLGSVILWACSACRIRESILDPRSLVYSFWAVFLPSLLLVSLGLFNRTFIFLALGIELILAVVFRRLGYRGNALKQHLCELSAAGCVMSLSAVSLFYLIDMSHFPVVRGGFFYHSEIADIIRAQAIPETVMHYGEAIRPQLDKLGYDLVVATYWLVSGTPTEVATKVGYLGTVLFGSLLCMILATKLRMPNFVVYSFPLFLYCNLLIGDVVTRRSFFIPESTAFLFLLAALCISSDWNRQSHQSRIRNAVTYLLAITAVILQHQEIALIFATLAMAAACVKATLKKSLSPILQNTSILACGGVIALGVFACIGKYPEFLPVAKDFSNIFEAYNGSDPTWAFLTELQHFRPFRSVPPFTNSTEILLTTTSLLGSFFKTFTSSILVILLLILALLPIGTRLRWRTGWASREGLVIATSLLSSSALLLLALALNWTSNIWVYATEGARRIAPYAGPMLCVVIICGASLATRLGWRRPLVKLIVPALAILIYVFSFPLRHPIDTGFPVSRDALSAVARLKASPSSGSILSNHVTSGLFSVYLNRPALLEGHQPFLRPDFLLRVLNKVSAAQSFFQAPTMEFVALHNITTIVVSMSGASDFGGNQAFPVSAEFSKQIASDFTEIGRWGDVAVYERGAAG